MGAKLAHTHLDGVGGDLDLVQLPHGAVTVDEVGRGQLMQGLHILRGVGQLPVQLVLGQVHGQRLLPWKQRSNIEVVTSQSPLQKLCVNLNVWSALWLSIKRSNSETSFQSLFEKYFQQVSWHLSDFIQASSLTPKWHKFTWSKLANLFVFCCCLFLSICKWTLSKKFQHQNLLKETE